MAKQVCRNLKVEVKGRNETEWNDISGMVSGFELHAKVGNLYLVDLALPFDRVGIKILLENDLNDSRRRVAKRDRVFAGGTELSDHLYAYRRETRVGEIEMMVLSLQADSDILRINGGHPWMEAPGRSAMGYEIGGGWNSSRQRPQCNDCDMPETNCCCG